MSIMINGVESFIGQIVYADNPVLQVMSDVWDNCPFVVVAKSDGTFETVWAEYTENSVDASPELIKAYTDKIERERKEAQFKERKRNFYNSMTAPCYGRTVEVVRGRKVAKGTKGILFWMRKGCYGTKIGIAVDGAKDSRGRFVNVAWTYLHNIEVVVSPEDMEIYNNMKIA